MESLVFVLSIICATGIMIDCLSLHSLDEAGYFIISADGSCQEIVAEYFPNIINAAGVPLIAALV